MKTFFKVILFFILFSFGFFWLRLHGIYFYNVSILISDLGGLTYLYSTVGIMFAIFSAFAILSQVERWNNLTDAVKKEAGALKELYFWSLQISDESLRNRFITHIKQYLHTIVGKAFLKSESGERDDDVDEVMGLLHSDIYETQKNFPQLMPIGFATFTDILKSHDERLHFASVELPIVLRNTLMFNDILLVLLSVLIGVRNMWLDYVFLISIAILCYLIHLVVSDLNTPMKSGNWQMTSKDYQEVLKYIK